MVEVGVEVGVEAVEAMVFVLVEAWVVVVVFLELVVAKVFVLVEALVVVDGEFVVSEDGAVEGFEASEGRFLPVFQLRDTILGFRLRGMILEFVLQGIVLPMALPIVFGIFEECSVPTA